MRQITDKHVVKCKLVDRFFPLIQYSCQLTTYYNMYGMAIRVVEFSSGGIRLERFLPKNQHTQRKLLNFEDWVNGEVSKIEHHFSK